MCAERSLDKMEDKLLQTAINRFYHDRPNIITTATQAIQDYCRRGKTNVNYDEVLKTLHNLMYDLPPNILLYFLTTVPPPAQEDTSGSTFSELMRRSRLSLLDNIQSVLTEYINNSIPPLTNPVDKDKTVDNETLRKQAITHFNSPKSNVDVSNIDTIMSKRKMDLTDDGSLLKKIKPSEIRCLPSYSCFKLIEICADYVVLNLSKLRDIYNRKNMEVWSLVNKDLCSDVEQTKCYEHIKDINRKLKWLRMIEAGHVSVDVIKELYGNSEIFLKSRHLYNLVDESAFSVSKELSNAIEKFINT